MKKFLFIIPLIIFSYFFYLNEEVIKPAQSQSHSSDFVEINSNKKLVSDYKITVKLFPEHKLLKASEEIVWRNFTDSSTNELHFHLYPNALSNNKTEFSKKIFLEEDEQTRIEISSLLVDGDESELTYFQPEVENPYDSTVGKIVLDDVIEPGDSVNIKIDYLIEIPKLVRRFGYAAGREFYFIAQWFPKLGVFENGKWICSQYHYNTEFYADFSYYEVMITVPQGYKVGASGNLVYRDKLGDNDKYLFKLDNAIDFAWFASNEISYFERNYKTNTGKEVQLNAFVQPENERRIERYFDIVNNTLNFLEENIGEYPYSILTFVDVPRSSNLGGMEYPTLFTFYTPMFSPRETHSPESTIIHETIHQYFYAAVANNEVYEAWLDEGITSYLEEKILDEYYGKPELYHRFIDYYPIFGINFLSIYEIPVIYSLKALPYENYSYNLLYYYTNEEFGNITDTSYRFPNRLSYIANTYSKPALVFHSLERYLGEEKFYEIIGSYYSANKFTHVTRDDLLQAINKESDKNIEWFIHNFIENNYRFDYRITSLTQVDSNKYEILVEKLEAGTSKVEIDIYTEDDTTTIKWSGEEDWKIFTIESDKPVVAAEIDPERQNLLDKNFANNSYTIESKYWAAYSMSIRWFFWIQNALLILGSIG